MFNITFEDENKTRQYAWQNSWGLTTRSIGIMVMVHGDDKGLVLPPRVAPVQVIVVPIPPPKGKGDFAPILAKALEIVEQLKAVGVRAQADTRDGYTPAHKYYHWEQKGVPLRVEYGMKDHESQQCVVALRYNGEKRTLKLSELVAGVQAMLQEVQAAMFERARKEIEGRISQITKWEDFIPSLDKGNRVLAPWCEDNECEETIKKKSGEHRAANDKGEAQGFRLTGAAKTLCLPFDQPPLPEHPVCFHCGKPAKKWCLFGRSY
jgi:prolyl-tRNA synthetase